VVFANTFGNLFLAIGMNHMPDFYFVASLHYLVLLLSNLWLIAGAALLFISMIAQLSLLSWADLTYVLPVTGGGYVLTALLSKFVLHEHVSPFRWAGVALISLGVMLVLETPPHEEPEMSEPA
jgi:drug/metabolite transporter (DMT)-like permease